MVVQGWIWLIVLISNWTLALVNWLDECNLSSKKISLWIGFFYTTFETNFGEAWHVFMTHWETSETVWCLIFFVEVMFLFAMSKSTPTTNIIKSQLCHLKAANFFFHVVLKNKRSHLKLSEARVISEVLKPTKVLLTFCSNCIAFGKINVIGHGMVLEFLNCHFDHYLSLH